MIYEELVDTMDALVIPGKGILAADESLGTIGKRFADIKVENNEQNRRDYRLLLCTAPELNEYINGMILYEETLTQADRNGVAIPQLLANRGIVPGIKVDKGLTELVNTDGEKVTQGLDGLRERLTLYKNQGAYFAKWRNVYTITDNTPSMTAVKTGAELLARYASTCQNLGIVPIVEPEVLMDGDHTIEHCAEVTEVVLHELFHALFVHQVELEYMILKPSMVISGKECSERAHAEEVADFTLAVFRNNVPASVPTINFLSGGQSPREATENLNAINEQSPQPWNLSFSYGRALQEDCLKAWLGKPECVMQAQQALLKRARLNSAAALGEYSLGMEES